MSDLDRSDDSSRCVVLEGRRLEAHEVASLLAGAADTVHVLRMPKDETSLDFLRPAAEGIRQLIVTDWSCEDLRALRELVNLEELALSSASPRHDVDMSGLLNLRSYSAPASPRLASAMELTGLVHIGLDKPKQEYLSLIRSRPQTLELTSARSVTGLPDTGRWDKLTKLAVHLARCFDVATLRRSRRIQGLQFDAVKRLEGVASLVELPQLDSLYLNGCSDVDEPAVLSEFADREVYLIGDRLPVDRDFVLNQFGSVPPRWRVAQKLDPATRRR